MAKWWCVEGYDKKRRKDVSSTQVDSLLGSPVAAGGDISHDTDGKRPKIASNDILDKLTYLLSKIFNKLDNSAPAQ